MGGLFGSGGSESSYVPPVAASVPQPVDASDNMQQASENKQAQLAAANAATDNITGGLGDTSEVETKTKTLGGV